MLMPATAAAQTAPNAEVFVLGALHDREEGFSFETLDRVIRRIGPDVMLLEVTPEELAGRLETRGRPEHPNVVWPMLGEEGAPRSYAMEAGQPLYGELIRHASRIWGAFANDRAAENAALTAYVWGRRISK